MFSFNDISDLTVFRTRAEMQAFIDQPVESIRYPPRTDVTQARSPSLIRRLAGASYVVKAYRWLKWRLGVGRALAAPAKMRTLSSGVTRRRPSPTCSTWRRSTVPQLVIAPISPFSRRDHEILRTTAKAYGLPLLDTSSLTVADASLWLPRDGHFSPAGARRMAGAPRGLRSPAEVASSDEGRARSRTSWEAKVQSLRFCSIQPPEAPLGRHRLYSMRKGASVARPVRPLMGRMS